MISIASMKARIAGWGDYWSDQLGDLFGKNRGKDLLEPTEEFRKAKRNLLWGVALGFVFSNARMPKGACFKVGIGGDLCLDPLPILWGIIAYIVYAWLSYYWEYWRMRALHSEARYLKADDNVGATLDHFSDTVSSAGNTLNDMIALIGDQIRAREELNSRAQSGLSKSRAASQSLEQISNSMIKVSINLSDLNSELSESNNFPLEESERLVTAQLKLEELSSALQGQVMYLGSASQDFSTKVKLLDEEKLHQAINRCGEIRDDLTRTEADVKQRAREFRQFSKSLHGRDIMASTWLDWALPNLAALGILLALTKSYWLVFAIWIASRLWP